MLLSLARIVSLDNLVHLATIEPNAAAGWAIIDLDPRSFAHDQRRTIDRAGHRAFMIGHLIPLTIPVAPT
jgi:hypothetical protein